MAEPPDFVRANTNAAISLRQAVCPGIKRPQFARFCGQNYPRKNAGFIVRAHYCESAGPDGEQALVGKEFRGRRSEHTQPYLRRQDEL